MTTQTKKSSTKFIAAGIGAVVVIAALFIPMVPISAQEEYADTETKQEAYTDVETRQEAYTDTETKREAYVDTEYQQQSYQEIETQNANLISGSDYTLEGGHYVYWSAFIQSGHRVEYSVEASDSVNTYVLTSSEFQQYVNDNNFNTVAERRDTESTRYGFTASIDDTYYFVVYNPHDGFFGIGDKKVGVYSATATATWEESVTKYKDVAVPVTKYRTVTVPVTKYHDVQVPVTKYRDVQVPVTKTKTVDKSVSIIELMQKR